MMSTIFGKIIAGEIPAEKLHEDEHCIVIRDVQPRAPVHILVIPKKPLPTLGDAREQDEKLLGHLLLVARKMAQDLGIGRGFRVIINNGEEGGQSVFHLHLHVLGGTKLTEADLGPVR